MQTKINLSKREIELLTTALLDKIDYIKNEMTDIFTDDELDQYETLFIKLERGNHADHSIHA
jgi:hypothetical protein